MLFIKENHLESERLTEWEKICANNISVQGCAFKIHKELLNLNLKNKTKHVIETWTTDMNRQLCEQRRHTTSQWASEKVLSVINHRGNTYRNHNSITLYNR